MKAKTLFVALAFGVCASFAHADDEGEKQQRPRQQQQVPQGYDDYDQRGDEGYYGGGAAGGAYVEGGSYGYYERGCYKNCRRPEILPYPTPHLRPDWCASRVIVTPHGPMWQLFQVSTGQIVSSGPQLDGNAYINAKAMATQSGVCIGWY